MRESGKLAKQFRFGGFSLVETAMALGIMGFAGVSLFGLFSLGLASGRDARAETAAAHLAQALLATRRASPTNALPGFPLPPVNVSAASGGTALFLNADGTFSESAADADFALAYRITAPGVGELFPARVYLQLHWPAGVPASAAAGRFELVSNISWK